MRKLITLSALTLLFQGTLACDDAEETGDSDEDADTDTDADADADTDTDTDVDTGPTDADGDGWTIAGGDCDDTDPAVHPEADEVVGDGVDQDCDGGEVCYTDGDSDGYGASATTVSKDLDCMDTGESAFGTDCDDGEASVHPGAKETCGDGIDQDCNGLDLRCGGWGEIDLSLADAKLVGENARDAAGVSVASGDMDGDGYADIVVGAYNLDAGGHDAGGAYLVLGPVSGEMNLSTADARLIGEEDNDYAGNAVAAGDVDGDGFKDIVVGDFFNDAGGEWSGAVFLLLSPVSGEVDLSTADAKLVGEEAGDEAGLSVAAGDVSGDGLEDILVGAPFYEGHDGAVYVAYGPVSGTMDLSMADARFVGNSAGRSLTTGDVDGDGVGDVVTGGTGKACVVFGPVSGDLDASDTDAVLVGGEGDLAVAAGDVNGDGFDDVIVGTSGTTYVVHGPMSGTVSLSTADALLEGAGHAVATGDVDGDGIEDVLAGDPFERIEEEQYVGAVYLVFGPVSGTVDLSEADARFVGEGFQDHAGWSLSTGDTDLDGADDILIGAPHEYPHGIDNQGALYLVLGGGS